MKRILWLRSLCSVAAIAVAGVAMLLLARAGADGKLPPKQTISLPANRVQAPVPDILGLDKLDHGKYAIEGPTKKLLAARTVSAAVPSGDAFVNPKVEPGKVHWHTDFAAACRAAEKSAKPVLLFQMMGKLDDQFC